MIIIIIKFLIFLVSLNVILYMISLYFVTQRSGESQRIVSVIFMSTNDVKDCYDFFFFNAPFFMNNDNYSESICNNLMIDCIDV